MQGRQVRRQEGLQEVSLRGRHVHRRCTAAPIFTMEEKTFIRPTRGFAILLDDPNGDERVMLDGIVYRKVAVSSVIAVMKPEEAK